MMIKFADFETFSNSAGVPLQRRGSTYHHCQCADQKTTGLRVLVVSPRKKYQSWKSEALLPHLRALPLHKTTKYAEFFLSWATQTSRYSQWEILREEGIQIPQKKKIQLAIALPGTIPQSGKLQIKLSVVPK